MSSDKKKFKKSLKKVTTSFTLDKETDDKITEYAVGLSRSSVVNIILREAFDMPLLEMKLYQKIADRYKRKDKKND